jgi:putative transposase
MEEGDYALYRDLMAERCEANGVACWAWCLMPNHVHLILTPSTAEVLSRAVGEAHRRYSGFVNARARVTGHVFRGRFGSATMHDAHLLATVLYLAFNPVRAGLVTRPEEWRWSSVRAHLTRRDDGLAAVAPLLERVPEPRDLFEMSLDEASALFAVETKSMTGRPLGNAAFLADSERLTERRAAPMKRGRRAKEAGENGEMRLCPCNCVTPSGDLPIAALIKPLTKAASFAWSAM